MKKVKTRGALAHLLLSLCLMWLYCAVEKKSNFPHLTWLTASHQTFNVAREFWISLVRAKSLSVAETWPCIAAGSHVVWLGEETWRMSAHENLYETTNRLLKKAHTNCTKHGVFFSVPLMSSLFCTVSPRKTDFLNEFFLYGFYVHKCMYLGT